MASKIQSCEQLRFSFYFYPWLLSPLRLGLIYSHSSFVTVWDCIFYQILLSIFRLLHSSGIPVELIFSYLQALTHSPSTFYSYRYLRTLFPCPWMHPIVLILRICSSKYYLLKQIENSVFPHLAYRFFDWHYECGACVSHPQWQQITFIFTSFISPDGKDRS